MRDQDRLWTAAAASASASAPVLEIQDEIAIHGLLASFDDLVDLALRVETRINLRRQRVMAHFLANPSLCCF